MYDALTRWLLFFPKRVGYANLMHGAGPPKQHTSYDLGHWDVNRICEELTQGLQTLCRNGE